MQPLTGPTMLGDDHLLRHAHSAAAAAAADPARAGLGAPVLEYLAGCGARAVVYVSCNPATQARDLALLTGAEGAFELEWVQPVDMFPHTEHVESVAVLQRRGG